MIATPRNPSSLLRVLQLGAVAFALASAGCDKIGCFEWTEAEGACPSQDEAMVYFGNPDCGGPVESVDSEPEFDGQFCCYDITKVDDNELYYCAGGI